jgi:hypothetical protein
VERFRFRRAMPQGVRMGRRESIATSFASARQAARVARHEFAVVQLEVYALLP